MAQQAQVLGTTRAAVAVALASVLAAAAGWTLRASSGAAQENRLQPHEPSLPYRLESGFLGEGAEPGVKDLSGVACRPIAGSERRLCVVVDDQTFFVQAATLEGRVLRPVGARTIQLFWPEEPRSARHGNRPGPVVEPVGGKDRHALDRETMERIACAERDAFKDLDGEGAAFDGSRFYVVGSHGCGRNNGKFRPSSFLLARMSVGGQGAAPDLQMTYRLSEILRAAPVVGAHFGKPLEPANPQAASPQGLNIEGVAALGDRLFFGLRAPSLEGDAFIVGARAEDLFTPRDRLPRIGFSLSRVPLGAGTGIRDLAALPGGDRLLLLSGPVDSRDAPFSLWTAPAPPEAHMAERPEARRLDGARHLGCLAPPAGEGGVKAEALLVLGAEDDALRVLVLHDGVPGGEPRQYRVRLGEARPPC